MKNDLLYPLGKNRTASSPITDSFYTDLSLDIIAKRFFPGSPDYAKSILCELLSDPEVISYRQDVLQDFLENEKLETVLYNILGKLYTFERTISSNDRSAKSFIDIGIQLQALQTYAECIDECYTFAQKTTLSSKGLSAVMSEISEIAVSEDFAILKKETERLDNIFSGTVRSVTIGINLDDLKRPCEMALLSVDNIPFRQPTVAARLFNKLSNSKQINVKPIGSFRKLENERTANEFDTALFTDLHDICKDIFSAFNSAVASYYKTSVSFLMDLYQQLTYYFGLKHAIELLRSKGIKFCRPEIAPSEDRIFEVDGMVDLPFIYELLKSGGSRPGETVIPNDVRMDNENGRVFILTGPNNSGKTTYTRAVGVCQVLFQAGMFVPGVKARISPVDRIYTHFPREETIGINTSRLTQECREFKFTFEHATRHSLILMNESFSSTSFEECLYIASGFIKLCRRTGCRAIFTTHLIDLASRVGEFQASVTGDSDIVSMVSIIGENADSGNFLTYKIEPREPYTTSRAKDILSKYGVDFDEMLRRK